MGLPVIVNLPAFVVVLVMTVILVIGVKESANFNNGMVLLKIGIILFFLAVGAFLIKPENWNNPALDGFAPNGFKGVSAAAAIIFFSYIGFDAVSTAAEEAKNPAKDMPFGIIRRAVHAAHFCCRVSISHVAATGRHLDSVRDLARGRTRVLFRVWLPSFGIADRQGAAHRAGKARRTLMRPPLPL